MDSHLETDDLVNARFAPASACARDEATGRLVEAGGECHEGWRAPGVMEGVEIPATPHGRLVLDEAYVEDEDGDNEAMSAPLRRPPPSNDCVPDAELARLRDARAAAAGGPAAAAGAPPYGLLAGPPAGFQPPGVRAANAVASIPDSVSPTATHVVPLPVDRRTWKVVTRYATGAQGDARGGDPNAVTLDERAAFQQGIKRVAILSAASSSGISLHDERMPDRVDEHGNVIPWQSCRRAHLIPECPWSAEKFVQQTGRTHRAGQVTAPEFTVVTIAIFAESRFTEAVRARIASLGALTRGDRRSASGIQFGDDLISKVRSKLAYGVQFGDHVAAWPVPQAEIFRSPASLFTAPSLHTHPPCRWARARWRCSSRS